jgi:hypothetical protein
VIEPKKITDTDSEVSKESLDEISIDTVVVDDLTQLLMNVGLEESGKFDEMVSDLVDDVKKTLESTDFLGKA